MAKKKSDVDDVSLDFGKLKKIFQKKKTKTESSTPGHEDKETEEFKVDISKARSFFSHKAVIVTVLIVIALFFSVYFRLYSLNLPVTDDWARNSLVSSIQNQVVAEINTKYPNLPSANKQELINKQLNVFMEQNQAEFDKQVEGTSAYFKQQLQDASGQTYLLAIDPYHHLRRVENLVKLGTICDKIEDGNCIDDHKYAPLGEITKPGLHEYIGLIMYKVVNFFDSNSTPKQVFFFLPILISALSVIPAFFIVRRRAGNFGGFVAALVVGVHPYFLGRTAGGFSDTDAYNVLFPLLITWIFLEAFESRNLRSRIILSSVGGLFVGLYYYAWAAGWWYIFDMIIAVLILYIGYSILKFFLQKQVHKTAFKRNMKNTLIVLFVFILASGIFITMFSGDAGRFGTFITGPLSRTTLKAAAKENLWPNVFTTVAELNAASVPAVINNIGGKLYFFIACLGLVLTFLSKEKIYKKDWYVLSFGIIVLVLLVTNNFMNFVPIYYLTILMLPVAFAALLYLRDDRDIDIKFALLFVIWFGGTIYMSIQGVRFILLLVPAFAVAFGVSLGLIFNMLSKLLIKEFNFNQIVVKVVLIVVLCLFLFNPIVTSAQTPMQQAHRAARGEVPSMNDAWWAALTAVRQNSSEAAILNSWWDFGHWFKYIADRSVTFDGASQNSPMAHWIGHTLLTNDEDKAVAILRMLDCGSNSAFEEVNKKYNDTLTSVNIVYDIIQQDKDDAEDYLKDEDFSKSQIKEILKVTHCDPPENFFITSQDMVGKSGVWGHFGSWSFKRAFIYNMIKKDGASQAEAVETMMDRFDYSEDEAVKIYFDVQALITDRDGNTWISGWPGYLSNLQPCRLAKNSSRVDCPMSIGVGQQNQVNFVVEAVHVDLSDIKSTTMTMGVYDMTTGVRIEQQSIVPNAIGVSTSDGIEILNLDGSNFAYNVLFHQTESGFSAMVMDPIFTGGLFTRLFYLEGEGLNHFEKFWDGRSVTGDRIIVWKVNWEGKNVEDVDDESTSPLITLSESP